MSNRFELIKINPFEDKRGSLKKIAMKSRMDIDIEEIYLLYSTHESVRGNHYHKETVEYFTVVSGTAKVALKDLENDNLQELNISSNDNFILKVPANIAHAFKNESEETLVILAVSSKEYNASDTDTFIMKILD
ncbi:MAG: WxcM-like domain-containing protein [Bacillota bacterium]|nr:WxcM-like domain-containing protein [Bacillota bacterium]